MKIEKLQKIAKSAVPALNTISSLISKALSDDSVSDEECSLILLEYETFTRMKEDLRIKSKTSLEQTGNIETEANELPRGNKIGVQNHVQNRIQNHVRNHVHNHGQNHAQNHVQNRIGKN